MEEIAKNIGTILGSLGLSILSGLLTLYLILGIKEKLKKIKEERKKQNDRQNKKENS